MDKGSLSARFLRAYQAFYEPPSGAVDTPVASFPFVSGDTFRQMAGQVFTGDLFSNRQGLSQAICFVSADMASEKGFPPRAETFVQEHETSEMTLLIHNGDKIPAIPELERLGGVFSRVFCVNVVEETENVRALPIGLENLRLNNNGKLAYYLDGIEASRSIDRSRLVVSSFHISNNPSVREPTADMFRKSRFGFDGHSWKRKEYRELLKDTCFVISPPGNGPDCHRTWEAIYMGAVPVVLKQYLARSLWEDMPILALDSYEEFLELSDKALLDSYRATVRKPATKAFATHWVREFS